MFWNIFQEFNHDNESFENFIFYLSVNLIISFDNKYRRCCEIYGRIAYNDRAELDILFQFLSSQAMKSQLNKYVALI